MAHALLQLKPELELLVLCARKPGHLRAGKSINLLLDQDLDWSLILKEAQRHCILPLLYANLACVNRLRRLPPEVREALVASVRAITATNLALVGELTRILRLFEQEGIRAIPFKGPMLALAAYGEYSSRSFADLDILVHESDLARALGILESACYRRNQILSPREERAYLKAECAVQLQSERGFVVELHWRFSERNASVNFPLPEIRQRAGTVALGGMDVRTLAVEDLLLYLCVHGAKHYWERLEWISSLAELIRSNPKLDWMAVRTRAKAWRVERLLFLGLHLAGSLLDAPVPEDVRSRIGADHKVASLAHAVVYKLFTEPDAPHYQHRAARYLFLLKTRESYADKLRILLFSAMKPPHPDAKEWLDLPPQLFFLQHIFRPIRLLGEYGSVAWRSYTGTRQ